MFPLALSLNAYLYVTSKLGVCTPIKVCNDRGLYGCKHNVYPLDIVSSTVAIHHCQSPFGYHLLPLVKCTCTSISDALTSDRKPITREHQRRLSDGIKNVTNPQDIANGFSDFLVNVGHSLAKIIKNVSGPLLPSPKEVHDMYMSTHV